MKAQVGVILCGSGYLDGSEIQESVFTLYFLERSGAKVQCYAPDRDQLHVVNHLTGESTGESRNALVESARIARGQVQALEKANIRELDALVLPGGYGAAKNLSSFAKDGGAGTVDVHLQKLLRDALSAKKPIVSICISPAIVALALQKESTGLSLTIGHDEATANAIEQLGSQHVSCPVKEIVVDEKNRMISTPAYMIGSGPAEVAAGIESAINKLMIWLTP